jgi:hypothetical protein
VTQGLFTYGEVDQILREGCRNDYVDTCTIDGLIASVLAGPADIDPKGLVAANLRWARARRCRGNREPSFASVGAKTSNGCESHTLRIFFRT